jgi:hypothetical protein
MKRAGRLLVFLACVLFSVTAFYNVMSDNEEVKRMAWDAACKKDGSNCEALKDKHPRAMERVPWAQTFTLNTPKGAEFKVRCTRSLVMVGDYACKVE